MPSVAIAAASTLANWSKFHEAGSHALNHGNQLAMIPPSLRCLYIAGRGVRWCQAISTLIVMGLASATPDHERSVLRAAAKHMSFNILELSSTNINLTGVGSPHPRLLPLSTYRKQAASTEWLTQAVS